MRALDTVAIAAAVALMGACFTAAHVSAATERPAMPQASLPAPGFTLVLLVNTWDGGQAETVLARDLPADKCVPMMQAIWQANGDAPLIGFDEAGPIPAFDAVCLPE